MVSAIASGERNPALKTDSPKRVTSLPSPFTHRAVRLWRRREIFQTREVVTRSQLLATQQNSQQVCGASPFQLPPPIHRSERPPPAWTAARFGYWLRPASLGAILPGSH